MSLLQIIVRKGLVQGLMAVPFAWGFISTAMAVTVTISTADNEYRPGLLNQQYAINSGQQVVYGDNTRVGSGGDDVTAWDFSLPHNLNTVTGATLLIPLGTAVGTTPDLVNILAIYPYAGDAGPPVREVLGDDFFVSPGDEYWPGLTPYIYATGTVTPGGDPTTMIAFTLSQQAIDDINAHAHGNTFQAADLWFPIAAASGGNSSVFIGNSAAQLVLTVPEPGSLALALAGVLILFSGSAQRLTSATRSRL